SIRRNAIADDANSAVPLAPDKGLPFGIGVERPSGRRAAEQRDELAASHSITSSAMASSEGGTVRPNMRAVVLLMTSSNLVDCITGKSPGLAPLITRPA